MSLWECNINKKIYISSWTDKFRMSTAVAHLFGIHFKLLSLGHRSQQNEVKSEPAYLWGLESIFVWLWREINVLLWEIDARICISCICLWASRKEKAWKYTGNPYLQEALWSPIQYFTWYKMFLYIINNKLLDAQSRNLLGGCRLFEINIFARKISRKVSCGNMKCVFMNLFMYNSCMYL